MKPNPERAGISLRDVLTSARFVQTSDVRVTACCTSPEEVSPGDLFIAVTQSGTILCFYGRGAQPGFAGKGLTLARFNLEWLTH